MRTLNKEQKKAVEAPFKPIFIIAGAGTGKTETLSRRLKYYLDNGIRPDRILAITFTRRATEELRERIKKSNEGVEIKNIFTFHAFFKHVLETETIEFKKLKIISDEGGKWLIRKFLKDMKKNSEVDDLFKEIKELKKFQKNIDLLPEEIKIKSKKTKLSSEELKEILFDYCEFLENNGFFDFDDLTYKISELLNTDEDFRSKLSTKFDAILIDEFQDTSELHFEIVKKITGQDSNIFFVGDPDQSIYGFRDVIKNSDKKFKEYYKDGEIITLEQNYRSTKPILETANKLIAHNYKNSKEKPKKLWTEKEGGEKVFYRRFEDLKDEMLWVMDEVLDLYTRKNVPLREIGILTRNNNPDIKKFVTAIKKRYKNWELDVVDKRDPLGEWWIRFFIAILFILLRDEVSIFFISDILEFIKKFNNDYEKIKEKDIEKFYDICQQKNIGFTDAIENIDSFKISEEAIEDFKKLGKTIINLREKKDLPINSWLEEILFELNCDDPKEKKDFYITKRIDEFILRMKKKRKLEKEEALMGILSYEERANIYFDKNEGLKISTIHSSKGLEYEYVFLFGVKDGVLPSDKKNSNEEEERRLTYVAFTRAKTKLSITFSPSKKRPDESRFIEESKDPNFFLEAIY